MKKHLLTRKDNRDVERDDRNKVDHIHAVRDKPGDKGKVSRSRGKVISSVLFSQQILTSTSLGRQRVEQRTPQRRKQWQDCEQQVNNIMWQIEAFSKNMEPVKSLGQPHQVPFTFCPE